MLDTLATLAAGVVATVESPLAGFGAGEHASSVRPAVTFDRAVRMGVSRSGVFLWTVSSGTFDPSETRLKFSAEINGVRLR